MDKTQKCISKYLYGFCIGYHPSFIKWNQSNLKEENEIKEVQNYKKILEESFTSWQRECWKLKWKKDCPYETRNNCSEEINFNNIYFVEHEDPLLIPNQDLTGNDQKPNVDNLLISNIEQSSQNIILKEWRVILSESFEAIIIGKIEGTKISWSNRIVNVIDSYKILTENNVFVFLVGPFTDTSKSTPEFIQNKFLHGFSKDWFDCLNQWIKYNKKDRPYNFDWNINEDATSIKSNNNSNSQDKCIYKTNNTFLGEKMEISNLDDTVEITNLDDTIEIDNDKLQNVLNNEISTDTSGSQNYIITMIIDWRPVYNPTLRKIEIHGKILKMGKKKEVRIVLLKMHTNVHFSSTNGEMYMLVGSLNDPNNVISDEIKKLIIKNFYKNFTKINKLWSAQYEDKVLKVKNELKENKKSTNHLLKTRNSKTLNDIITPKRRVRKSTLKQELDNKNDDQKMVNKREKRTSNELVCSRFKKTYQGDTFSPEV